MSNERIVNHLYQQIITHSTDSIRDALARQEVGTRKALASLITHHGAESASRWANNVVGFSHHYSGRQPAIADLIGAMNELHQNNIVPGTPEFKYQVENMGSRQLLRTYTVDNATGESTALEGSDASRQPATASDPKQEILQKAMVEAQRNLKDVRSYGDRDSADIELAQRRVDRLQSQLGEDQPAKAGDPGLLSEAQRAAFQENLGGHGMPGQASAPAEE